MKKRKILLIVLLVTLCLSAVVSAVAAEVRTVKLDAGYRDIKINLFGEIFTPKDANGKVVEPFIVDGTTYVPLRAIGEAFNLDVKWESSSSTIFISEYPDDPDYLVPPPEPSKKVDVSTAEELVKAIAPDTCITLKAGKYDLSKVTNVKNPYVTWSDDYYGMDEKTLVISNLEGLTLQAAPGAEVEIVTPWLFANVLKFAGCDGVSVVGIKAGHTVTSDYECDNGVLLFDNCNFISVEDCFLYGSGTIGIEFYGCIGADIINTTVTDCSRRAVDLAYSYDIVFDNCKFIDNRAYQGVLYGMESTAEFYDCVITGNKSLIDSVASFDYVVFERCVFRDNAQIDGIARPVFDGEWVQLYKCEIEKGNFDRYWETGTVVDHGENKLT